jgi:hypothetical protein
MKTHKSHKQTTSPTIVKGKFGRKK